MRWETWPTVPRRLYQRYHDNMANGTHEEYLVAGTRVVKVGLGDEQCMAQSVVKMEAAAAAFQPSSASG